MRGFAFYNPSHYTNEASSARFNIIGETLPAGILELWRALKFVVTLKFPRNTRSRGVTDEEGSVRLGSGAGWFRYSCRPNPANAGVGSNARLQPRHDHNQQPC